jgi:hypothetical protein
MRAENRQQGTTMVEATLFAVIAFSLIASLIDLSRYYTLLTITTNGLQQALLAARTEPNLDQCSCVVAGTCSCTSNHDAAVATVEQVARNYILGVFVKDTAGAPQELISTELFRPGTASWPGTTTECGAGSYTKDEDNYSNFLNRCPFIFRLRACWQPMMPFWAQDATFCGGRNLLELRIGGFRDRSANDKIPTPESEFY